MNKLSLLFALPIVASSLGAQKAASFDFTIKNMMRGPEVYGREPQNVRWSADGKWIYFNWLEPGSDWRLPARPFRVRAAAGAKPERVTEAQMDSVAPLLDNGKLSPDGKTRIVSSAGDLFLVDVSAGTARRLTETLENETIPRSARTAARSTSLATTMCIHSRSTADSFAS